jgi:hypothetical protein
MDDLRYRMIMALNAADIGHPLCDQVALICAEIAEQHCAEIHRAATAAFSTEEALRSIREVDAPQTPDAVVPADAVAQRSAGDR